MSNSISSFNTQTGLYVSDNKEHPAIGASGCNDCEPEPPPPPEIEACLPVNSIVPHWGVWTGNVVIGAATWALADGTPPTLDLRGQLLRGNTVSNLSLGNSTSSHTIIDTEMPYHKHTPLASAGATTFLMQTPVPPGDAIGSITVNSMSEKSSGIMTPAAVNTPISFNNDPPYRTLKFIQRIS